MMYYDWLLSDTWDMVQINDPSLDLSTAVRIILCIAIDLSIYYKILRYWWQLEIGSPSLRLVQWALCGNDTQSEKFRNCLYRAAIIIMTTVWNCFPRKTMDLSYLWRRMTPSFETCRHKGVIKKKCATGKSAPKKNKKKQKSWNSENTSSTFLNYGNWGGFSSSAKRSQRCNCWRF
jgi:hypothetical protein